MPIKAFLILRRSAYKVVNKLLKTGDLDKKATVFLSFTTSAATGVFTGLAQGARDVTHRVRGRGAADDPSIVEAEEEGGEDGTVITQPTAASPDEGGGT